MLTETEKEKGWKALKALNILKHFYMSICIKMKLVCKGWEKNNYSHKYGL